MTWRPRLVVASAALGALVAVAVWVAGPSLTLRTGPVSAFRPIPAQAAQSPSSPPPVVQASRVQSPAPPKQASNHPPANVAAATCTKGNPTLIGFSQAPSIQSGTIRIAWSVSDQCPPYHGYIQGAYLYSDAGLRIVQHPIRDLAGLLVDSYDCSSTPHLVNVKYQLNLWDNANHMAFAQANVNVC
ncbi:MAG TPA: hypothetical protein VFL29_04415 [Candidatus Dormibacteraeota bacterium]|nr:hypothetical protein [Candidatus Dormibacteraeota bacterium]